MRPPLRSFEGNQCRCGNTRLIQNITFGECNVACSGVLARPNTTCEGAYCCGGFFDGSGIPVTLSMVGNIPIESVVAKQASAGIVERFAAFSPSWLAVSAIAGLSLPKRIDENHYQIFVFQGTVGRVWVRSSQFGPILPHPGGRSSLWNALVSRSVKSYDFSLGASVSDVLGGTKLVCAFTTVHYCFDAAEPAVLLWLVRADGSYETMVKEPLPGPNRDSFVRNALTLIQRLPIFRPGREWSFNPNSPSRSFPTAITSCAASASTEEDRRDSFLIYLFSGRNVWTAHLGTTGTPFGIKGPHLTGINPRPINDVFKPVPADYEPTHAWSMDISREAGSCSGRTLPDSLYNIWLLRGFQAAAITIDTGRNSTILGFSTVPLSQVLASPDVSPPRPLEELEVELSVAVPTRGIVARCYRNVLVAESFKCEPVQGLAPSIEMLIRSYTQGKLTNVQQRPAPGEPDQGTYHISLANPLPTNAADPAPSQFMRKSVTTSYTTSVEMSFTVGVSTSVAAHGSLTTKANGGVPGVADGGFEIQKGVSITAGFSSSVGKTFGSSTTYSEEYEITLEVPAGACFQATVENVLRSGDVPFESDLESWGFVSIYHQGPPSKNETGGMVPSPRLHLGDYSLENLIFRDERIFRVFGELQIREQLVKQGRILRLPIEKC